MSEDLIDMHAPTRAQIIIPFPELYLPGNPPFE